MLELCLRIHGDTNEEKIGHKIRKHLWQDKLPFVAVVGDRELEQGGMAVRHRQDGDLGQKSPAEFAGILQEMTVERR